MKDRLFVLKAVSVVLCFVIIAVAFSMYRKDAETVEVTIGFGEIVELQVGGEGETSAKVLTPDVESTVTLVLSSATYKDDGVANQYTHGKFFIEVVQKTQNTGKKLSDALVIVAKCGDETISSDAIIKKGANEPAGYVKELSESPVRIGLTYKLSDEAKQNFLDYAGQEVSIVAHWVKASAPLSVHVFKKWSDAVYCAKVSTDGTETVEKLKFAVNDVWSTFTVSSGVTSLKFSADQSFTDVVEISLAGVTKNEIWLTLDDETISYVNPDL